MRKLSIHPAPLRSLSDNSGDNGNGKNFDIINRRGGSNVTERWQRIYSIRQRLEEELKTKQNTRIDT
jgi:hypothetical protein